MEIDAAAWGFIGTIVGAVVGSAASILTTVIAGRNQSLIQKREDSYQRIERSRAFQRSNYLELQESLHDLLRSLASVHLADSYAAKASGTWGKSLLPEGLAEEYRLEQRRASILTERVENDFLRENVKELTAIVAELTFSRSQEEADSIFNRTSVLFSEVMIEIGKHLRETY